MGIKGNKKPLPAVTGSGHVQSEMNLMNHQILADIEPIVKHPSLARDASQLEIFKTKFKPLQGTVFTHFFKEKLWNASDKKCAYCGIELYCFTDVRVDHFQPKSKILIEHVDNYVCSCASCNSMKCNVDIEEFRFRFAVYNSSIRGIILPSQAKQLVDVGVDLPIQLGEFYFEKVCEGKNV